MFWRLGSSDESRPGAATVWLSAAAGWKPGFGTRVCTWSGRSSHAALLMTELLRKHAVRGSGFADLAISSEHAIAAGRLPLIHRDPFDRMLVAQAQCEDFTLVTRPS